MAAGQPKVGYLSIQNFRFGLDARRSELTSQPGTLLRAVDCHVTQGAELEKRKAFVKTALPANTFPGLPTLTTQWVFGSIAIAPSAMPGGFTYKQLTSPLGSAMTALISATLFDGKAFVVAAFGPDGTFCFYDGTLVGDFTAGLVLTGLTFNNQQATNLAALIHNFYLQGSIAYDATATGTVVTIVGTNGSNYSTVDSLTTAGSGAIATIQENVGVGPVSGTQPTGSFTIQAGALGTGGSLGNIYSITLGGSAFLLSPVIGNGPVNWTGSTNSMAAAVATAINSKTGTTTYSALANGNVVTVYGPVGNVATPLDLQIITFPSSNSDGAVCLQNCSFNFTIPTGGVITVTNIVSAKAGTLTGVVSIASTSYTTLQLFLNALAEQIMLYTVTHLYTPYYVAVGVIGNANSGSLFISANVEDGQVVSDEITITFNETGGVTLSGVAGMSATVLPSTVGMVYGSAGGGCVVYVKGGYAPYTYAWKIDNSAFSFFISNQTSNTVGFSYNGSAKKASAIATCVVTDSNGATVTVTVNLIVLPSY